MSSIWPDVYKLTKNIYIIFKFLEFNELIFSRVLISEQ
jgi:hypothetical protein